MLFCPRCSNLLLLGTDGPKVKFCCQTCPYAFKVEKKMKKVLPLERKKAPEIESNRSFSKIDSMAKCPKCANQKAYYFELQTRSADEPSTLFYKCMKDECSHVWTE